VVTFCSLKKKKKKKSLILLSPHLTHAFLSPNPTSTSGEATTPTTILLPLINTKNASSSSSSPLLLLLHTTNVPPPPPPRLWIPPTPRPYRSTTNSAVALYPPPQHLQLLSTPTPIRSETSTLSWFIDFLFFFSFPPFSLKSRRSPRLSPRSAINHPECQMGFAWIWVSEYGSGNTK
jgi:hypothetical protein